jgi:hypothetical protein
MRVVLAVLVCATLFTCVRAEIELRPYSIDWTATDESVVDLSGFLDAPAGRDGFVTVKGKHLVKPDGTRFRIWGVNICGPLCFPEEDVARATADDLDRMGINCVRFHHMDSNWGRNPFDRTRDDTRRLDPESLDRLDYFVAELKERGIYTNLNLNVSRRFKAGDDVRDHELLGYGKSATYFNPRLIELQREYAEQLLTHRNAYTGHEYRHEPAVLVVEMVNENSVLEGWVSGRLVGRDVDEPGTWTPIPVSYAEELTDLYNRWLPEHVTPEQLRLIRREVGVGSEGRVPRLKPAEFAKASRLRFHTEATFYMELERKFFGGMRQLLKDKLGVRSLLVGTSDHNDGFSGYTHIHANLIFDIVDGHGYWQHPRLGDITWIKNTPMVNDPLDSTVTQFARTPVVGRPYTISETNHPYPHEYACEGFPILTAYALFHDWDGIYWFTYGQGRAADPKQGIRPRGWFDFSNDPVKMTTLYACALMWYRQDLRPARRTVVRSYTMDEAIESLRMDRSKGRPFFKPGFARSTPLQHTTRFQFGHSEDAPFPESAPLGRIEADTGQLVWHDADKAKGVVTVDSNSTQALIGFVKAGDETTTHFSAEVDNEFCCLLLTSMDGAPIRTSRKLLLTTTALAANTGVAWEDDRKTLAKWGGGPVVIEPVTGTLSLRDMGEVNRLTARPLTAAGSYVGPVLNAERQADTWRLDLDGPPTTWYVIDVQR